MGEGCTGDENGLVHKQSNPATKARQAGFGGATVSFNPLYFLYDPRWLHEKGTRFGGKGRNLRALSLTFTAIVAPRLQTEAPGRVKANGFCFRNRAVYCAPFKCLNGRVEPRTDPVRWAHVGEIETPREAAKKKTHTKTFHITSH